MKVPGTLKICVSRYRLVADTYHKHGICQETPASMSLCVMQTFLGDDIFFFKVVKLKLETSECLINRNMEPPLRETKAAWLCFEA